ncbi:hypothetical protein BCR32DRAFT_295933 [Anaeromyces robustus]|uniref:Uncharacterized protein n=1 Tax=Anaeromyces robustus TaxID=1754192 RepID=A0A1Y1WUF8_9FUNG|nr:hypothetical protein BCR32DRAFT_295933 [Anaeromyces robustus]|eukprot:ORX76938.1 hypothetical protein BCR32DRAFT_295933 [Anaeromyces robustus]
MKENLKTGIRALLKMTILPIAPTNSFLNYVNNFNNSQQTPNTINTSTNTATAATSSTTYTNYVVPPTALDPNAPPMAYNSYTVPQQPFSPGNAQMIMPTIYQNPISSNIPPYANIRINTSTDNSIPPPYQK